MSVELALAPDERALLRDLEGGAFQLGVHLQRWRQVSLRFPRLVVQVSAAKRANAPDAYAFAFDCEGFPQAAPTARLWDASADAPLAHSRWPTGASRCAAVFRPDWQEGRCVYLPCDRISAAGHGDWRHQHPSLIWDPRKGIVLYLEALRELLNADDYTGVRGG